MDKKRKEIYRVESLVKGILEDYPQTRSSDMELYIHVCQSLNADILTKSFSYALTNLKQNGLPAIETVGRCRRRLQAIYPELSAAEIVENARKENEDAFIDYSRGGIR